MKIAVSSTGPDLDAEVDPRFGRCAYLLVVDPDSLEMEVIENQNKMMGGGAGIQTARMVAERGVEVVLTGNCGPNAYQTLSAAGVQIITGVSGTVRRVVEDFKQGNLRPTGGPNVESHFGMAPGGGRGMGMGMGKGMGMGGGGGGGRRMWMGAGPQPPGGMPGGGDAGSEAMRTEIGRLREEVREMGRRLDAVLERLEKLGKG